MVYQPGGITAVQRLSPDHTKYNPNRGKVSTRLLTDLKTLIKMQTKRNNRPRPGAARGGGTAPKKKKAKGPKKSVFLMVFYWILALLLALAIYFKAKHFYNSHWNKDTNEKTTILLSTPPDLKNKP